MSSSELLKIKDDIAAIASQDSGNMLLSLLQGPVMAFFDERNYTDKTALEAHINNQLTDIGATYSTKLKMMEGYFSDTVKLVNIMQGMDTREEQYASLVQQCNVTEQLNSAAIFEAVE